MLRTWVPSLASIESIPFLMPRGLPRFMTTLLPHIPVLKHLPPGITRIRFAA